PARQLNLLCSRRSHQRVGRDPHRFLTNRRLSPSHAVSYVRSTLVDSIKHPTRRISSEQENSGDVFSQANRRAHQPALSALLLLHPPDFHLPINLLGLRQVGEAHSGQSCRGSSR